VLVRPSPARCPSSPDRGITSLLDAAGRLSRFTSVAEAAPPRRRCLIVDDDPVVRETVRDMLKSRGYETVLAGDGVEGSNGSRRSSSTSSSRTSACRSSTDSSSRAPGKASELS
jgi:hypothetical protein